MLEDQAVYTQCEVFQTPTTSHVALTPCRVNVLPSELINLRSMKIPKVSEFIIYISLLSLFNKEENFFFFLIFVYRHYCDKKMMEIHTHSESTRFFKPLHRANV